MGRTPFPRVAFMLDQLCAGHLVIVPRLRQGSQSGLRAVWALKAPCLQVTELRFERFTLAFLRLAHACFSPLHRSLTADHKPALGHAIMSQLQAVITRTG